MLFSTHILSDVEQICDRVALLEKGSIALEGTIDEIKSSHGQGDVTIVAGSDEECKKLIGRFGKLVRGEHNSQKLKESEQLPDVLRYIADEGITLMRLERGEVTLEDLFMEVISE